LATLFVNCHCIANMRHALRASTRIRERVEEIAEKGKARERVLQFRASRKRDTGVIQELPDPAQEERNYWCPFHARPRHARDGSQTNPADPPQLRSGKGWKGSLSMRGFIKRASDPIASFSRATYHPRKMTTTRRAQSRLAR